LLFSKEAIYSKSNFFTLFSFLASRAKLMISSKVQSSKGHAYNQPEGVLSDSMTKYGRKLGEDNFFGKFNFSLIYL